MGTPPAVYCGPSLKVFNGGSVAILAHSATGVYSFSFSSVEMNCCRKCTAPVLHVCIFHTQHVSSVLFIYDTYVACITFLGGLVMFWENRYCCRRPATVLKDPHTGWSEVDDFHIHTGL